MEKNKMTNASRKVGDAVEKAGQKISDAGATRAGNAVYNTGDKIEHANDPKNPQQIKLHNLINELERRTRL